MSKKLKIRPSIFSKAAKRINVWGVFIYEKDYYCCQALEFFGANQTELNFFEKNFKPKRKRVNYPWFGSTRITKNQLKRIEVLKRAAELAKKENLK
jgi:hypothetical protein